VRVKGHHLPATGRVVPTKTRSFGAVEIELPVLPPADLLDMMQATRSAAVDHLRGRSVDDVLATIDRAVANWLSPDYPLRCIAEQALPVVTGFSIPMIRHGLPLLLAPLRADGIRELLKTELGISLEHHRRLKAPELITHVMSANIPGLAATPMLLSLVVKSAALIKSAAADPLSAALFADSISEVDDELGQCIMAAQWNGGDEAIEDVAFGHADIVVATGSDAAIAAIEPRVRGRFIGYGHRISFAAIGRECLRDDLLAEDLARRLAYDVSLWDQQGCLSPQLCYVETGGRIAPENFAELLARELAVYACELPPRRLSFEEKAAILRFRHAAEWGNHDTVAMLASPDSTDWSISVERSADFRPTCLNRCIRINVVSDLSELHIALTSHRRHLEAAGIVVAAERVAGFTAMLSASGVHRVCPIGTMQQPSLLWRQGGRPRVADWVERE
jgi:hypothetical protein